MGASAWGQVVSWSMSSTSTYTGGQELSSNTDVVSVKLGSGTWEYNSTWGVCETSVGNDKKPTLTDDIPTAGNYIVIVPTVDIAMTLDVRSSTNHNFYLVESTAPTTHIIDVRDRYYQTFNLGSANVPLKAGKTYYAYSAGSANLGYHAFTAKTVENYSIHYVDNSATPVTIKDDVVYNGLYNDEVTASESDKANITYNDVQYAYASGNETITLGTGTNEITLIYAAASQQNYTINAVAGGSTLQELGSGTLYEGETYGVYLKEIITKDGKMYVLDDKENANINTYYAGYTMGATDANNEINYTLDEDVVAFFECENMTYSHNHYKTISSDYSGYKYTASNGNAACIYADANIKTSSTIAAGKYEIDINVSYKWRDNGTTVKLQYSADGETWNDISSITYSGSETGLKTVLTAIPESSYLRILDVTGATPSHFFDYIIVRKISLSSETAVFNALKTYADALVAVGNDNSAANSTLASAISTQASAVDEALTAEAITNATTALKEAMNTYVAAANPTTGNQFDLTYMLTNPDLENITDWGDAAAQGWFTDIARTDLGDYNNFVVRTNLNSGKNAVERFTSNACTTANTYALYQKLTLSAGNYTFAAYALGGTTIVMAADNTEGDAVTATDFTEYDVQFTKTSEGETKVGLKISAEGTNTCNWMAITGLKLYKTAPTSVSVPVTNGFATYANHTYNLDFSNVEGLVAYTATVNADKTEVTFTPATQVPAGTGLLLKGATANVPVIASAAAISSNLMYAPTTAVSGLSYDDGTYYNYILTQPSGKSVGFYRANNNKVAVGKAYLRIPQASGARQFTFIGLDGDSEATGISSVESNSKAADCIYNLSGQRVAQPKNGLYIVNGKKVIVNK